MQPGQRIKAGEKMCSTIQKLTAPLTPKCGTILRASSAASLYPSQQLESCTLKTRPSRQFLPPHLTPRPPVEAKGTCAFTSKHVLYPGSLTEFSQRPLGARPLDREVPEDESPQMKQSPALALPKQSEKKLPDQEE